MLVSSKNSSCDRRSVLVGHVSINLQMYDSQKGMNKLWCIWGRKKCILLILPVHILCTLYISPLALFIGPSPVCSPCHNIFFSPSFSFLLFHSPLSFNNTLGAETGESELDFMPKSWKKATRRERKGEQRKQGHLETLLSCISARWFDGRLCEEEGEDS